MTNATTTSPVREIERAIATPPGEGDAWWFLGTRAVLRNPMGSPALPAVIELTVPPGGSPPLHVHDDLDDCFYLLSGKLAVQSGDERFVASAGSYVALPAGRPHTFRVMGNRPARMLLIHADTSFWELVKSIGEPATAPGLPQHQPEVDIAAIERANLEHGSRVLGPSFDEGEAAELLASLGAPPSFDGVDHVAFEVSDLRVSEPWYRDVLGLVPEMAEVHDDGSGHVALLHPGTGMVFTLLSRGPEAGAPTGVEHVALECDGRDELERWRAGLADRGFAVGTITDAPYGSGFVIRDPDGIELELFAVPAGH